MKRMDFSTFCSLLQGQGCEFIGTQLPGDLVYTPNDFLYVRQEFTWFDAGDYLKKWVAERILFFY